MMSKLLHPSLTRGVKNTYAFGTPHVVFFHRIPQLLPTSQTSMRKCIEIPISWSEYQKSKFLPWTVTCPVNGRLELTSCDEEHDLAREMMRLHSLVAKTFFYNIMTWFIIIPIFMKGLPKSNGKHNLKRNRSDDCQYVHHSSIYQFRCRNSI